MKKLLVVGTLPPPVGGTSISFGDFVSMAEAYPAIKLSLLDSGGLRNEKGTLKFTKFLLFIAKFRKSVKNCDVVMLHLSFQALSLLAPFAIFLCKLYRKKLVIRRFGGVLHSEMNLFHRTILNFTLKHSNTYLVETKRQVNELSNDNVSLYSTGRSKKLFGAYFSPPKRLKKMSFISQVKKSKGIFELIESVGKRPDLQLEIYGPLFDSIMKSDLEKYPNVKYLGIAKGEQVKEVISKTDVICLPSYYPGEGYPGIIFEAIHCGKPVLISNWKSLPDLVYRNSGVIVDSGSVEAISEGIEMLESIIIKKVFIQDVKVLSNQFDSEQIFKSLASSL